MFSSYLAHWPLKNISNISKPTYWFCGWKLVFDLIRSYNNYHYLTVLNHSLAACSPDETNFCNCWVLQPTLEITSQTHGFWTTCAQLFHNLVSFRHQHFLLLLVIHKWREGVQTTFAEVGLNVGICMWWYGANKQTIIIGQYILHNLELISGYILADFRKLVALARTWMITCAVSPWSQPYLDPTATRGSRLRGFREEQIINRPISWIFVIFPWDVTLSQLWEMEIAIAEARSSCPAGDIHRI